MRQFPIISARLNRRCGSPGFTSIKLHELVAAHTSTKAGLSDSILVTQSGVALWCRQEFHANSTKIPHRLC